MPAIHQFVAGFTRHDAISNEALAMRTIFRSWGCESDIFCRTAGILPDLRREARDAAEYGAIDRSDTVALLHLSIGSPVNDLFPALRARKVILYHNVTPARYFREVNPAIAHDLEAGAAQMKALAGTADLTLADSRFNADELAAAGYGPVQVLPLIVNHAGRGAAPDRATLRRFGDGKINVLFVGRCAPNKRIEDLLAAFFFFQRWVAPDSRLVHVGSHAGTERYYYSLMARLPQLGLREVHFAGCCPQSRLNAFYDCAHVFLCMSEHEGFCAPLLESMAHDVPVLAFAAGAVPETLDGAGVLFRRKDFAAVAEMAGSLARDKAVRAGVLRRQRERLARFQARDPEAELKRLLTPLMQP